MKPSLICHSSHRHIVRCSNTSSARVSANHFSGCICLRNQLYRCPNTFELDGLSADSTGALTPLPGSPFWITPTYSLNWSLTHSANWLFASDGSNIYSFSIASNGALTLKSSTNAQQFASTGVEAITALFLDHTWSNLYATLVDVSGKDDNGERDPGLPEKRHNRCVDLYRS